LGRGASTPRFGKAVGAFDATAAASRMESMNSSSYYQS
jgi:hypothetical protein